MAHQPPNQPPLLPQKPRSPGGVASAIGEYVAAFVRITFWGVVLFVVGGLAFIAIRAVTWAVQLTLEAAGV